MTPVQTVRLAVRALRRNKMRSSLTTAGVVIGVAAVVAMVAIGEGAKKRVQQTFESMGTNMLMVTSGSSRGGGLHGGMGSQPSLTWDDLKAIRSECPAVALASPVTRSGATVQSEDTNWTTQLNGVSSEYFEIRRWRAARGRLFTVGDDESGAKVVNLGATVADKLFGPEADPVGQMIRVRNIPFTVIGVLEKKGQSAMGQDQDDVVLLPITTFRSKIQGGALGAYIGGVISVSAVSADATARAQSQITALLRDRHRLDAATGDDFSIRNLSEFATAQEEGMQVLSMLLASIAAVSLVVGGIGIMNIMLVSVTERTREIGIRMAVGAKPQDILTQFLVEALTLSCMGGLLGVALGVGVAKALSERFDWPLVVRADVVAVAVGFSALVGIVFGLYPAAKASRLDPIQALRYE